MKIFSDRFRGHFAGPVGEDGRPVERTKWEFPYSYDPFVIWSNGGQANETVYTDRLSQWDYEKTERLITKHLRGMRWENAPPERIENFLREYLNVPTLELVRVMECCNWSNGFPLWRLDFFVPKEEPQSVNVTD